MNAVPSTQARQQWAQTLDQAKLTPVVITEHGRETAVVMSAELARRALEALEDAEDADRIRQVRAEIAAGAPTYSLEEVARELGVEL